MTGPRLLDLFCGAGGATKGYQLAGFHVTGVDIEPQPDYCGDQFIQADAMTYPLDGFDAVHASPPCQGETSCRTLHPDIEYERLLIPTLERLSGLSAPWVVENVDNADGPAGAYKVRLCGSSFMLRVRRHRWFWSNVMLLVPACNHAGVQDIVGVYGHSDGTSQRRTDRTRGPRQATTTEARHVMDMPWATTRRGITNAVPPAYTEHIGAQLLQHVRTAA